MTITPPMTAIPDWLLTEPVRVTLVEEHFGIYLIEHLPSIDCEHEGGTGETARSAVTLTAGARILLNGTDVELEDDFVSILGLLDDVGHLALGHSVISKPEGEASEASTENPHPSRGWATDDDIIDAIAAKTGLPGTSIEIHIPDSNLADEQTWTADNGQHGLWYVDGLTDEGKPFVDVLIEPPNLGRHSQTPLG